MLHVLTHSFPTRRACELREPGWRAEGTETAADCESAIALAGEVPAISVIGGSEIFALFLPLATRIELTEVQVEAAGDTVMPPFSPAMWRETAREAHATDRKSTRLNSSP